MNRRRTSLTTRSCGILLVMLLTAGALFVPITAAAAPAVGQVTATEPAAAQPGSATNRAAVNRAPVNTAATNRAAANSAAVNSAAAVADPDSPPLTYWGSARQMITVVADSEAATTAMLTAWERTDAGWRAVLGPITAFVGAAGIGQASENSTKTPAGVWSFGEAFGRQANPGTAMPYFTTDVYDWWNGNSSSPVYNTHVRQAGDPGASENLYRIGAVYDYAIDMGYNRSRTPGAGSAFFLHVTNGQPTGGCVAVDRDSMIRILQWLDPAKSPVINIGTAPASTRNPIGHLDTARLTGDTVRVAGWAFDPDRLRAPINVHIYDFRPDGTKRGASVTAGASRSDVASRYPGVSAGHGYNSLLRLTGPGRHRVCVYAINFDRGTTNPSLGCATFDLPPPVGSFDSLASTSKGIITVQGWAADPVAPGKRVQVLVSVRGPAGLTEHSGIVTDQPRADVAAAVPWAGGTTGFTAALPAQGDGTHQVCTRIAAVNYASATVDLGCRSVVVRSSFGHLDAVTPGAGKLTVTGWALNPNNPAEQVTIRIYDAGPSGVREYLDVIAGSPRSDLARVYPAYGPNHGLRKVLSADPGEHMVCVFSMTTGGGYGDPLLGCRTVQV